MRNRPILLLLLCATGAAAQIPTLTNSANIKFVQGNTIFDRPVSDLLALVGAENITVTGNWTFSSNLTQLKDAGTYFYDDGDVTKLMRFQLSGITTATTRNLTVPNADGTIALTGAAYGGTGQSAVAQGDLLYGSSTDTWGRLAKSSTATRYLANTGVGNSPAWAQVDMTNGVTGTLPVANGGTGAATFTNNRLLTGNGTSAIVDESALTFDGTTLTLTGNASQSVTGSYGTAQSFYNQTGTLTSTANTLTHSGIRSGITFANDGTPTNNNYYAGNFIAGASGSTAAAALIGLTGSASSSGANIADLYGLKFSVSETYAGADLTDRIGTDLTVTYGGASDHHTGHGLRSTITTSSTGRWNTAYGAFLQSFNGITNYGTDILTTNNIGTGNTAFALRARNTVSGSGVTATNVYGVSFVPSVASGGAITTYHALHSSATPPATNNYWANFTVTGWRGYVNGSFSLGVDDATNGRLVVRGAGATSGTNTALFENSSGTDILIVRDDAMSAFGTTPVSTEKLLVRGATSDNTTKAFVAERSSGTDVLGVQNDGKVSINNAAYTEELTINGQAQLDGVIYTNVTGSTTASGHVVYTDDATHGGYMTVGDGDRQLAIMPTMLERHVLDWAVNWTTGRKGAFWTVPARFNGWKISKAYISVTGVGSGAGDDELSIEVGGVVEGVQIVTAGTHTLVMDEVVNTDDVITFNITAISATPAHGLHVALELSKN